MLVLQLLPPPFAVVAIDVTKTAVTSDTTFVLTVVATATTITC